MGIQSSVILNHCATGNSIRKGCRIWQKRSTMVVKLAQRVRPCLRRTQASLRRAKREKRWLITKTSAIKHWHWQGFAGVLAGPCQILGATLAYCSMAVKYNYALSTVRVIVKMAMPFSQLFDLCSLLKWCLSPWTIYEQMFVRLDRHCFEVYNP